MNILGLLAVLVGLVGCESKTAAPMPWLASELAATADTAPAKTAPAKTASAKTASAKTTPAHTTPSTLLPPPSDEKRTNGFHFTVVLGEGWKTRALADETLEAVRGNTAVRITDLTGDDPVPLIAATRTEVDCKKVATEFGEMLKVSKGKIALISASSRKACELTGSAGSMPFGWILVEDGGFPYLVTCTSFENAEICRTLAWSVRRDATAKPDVTNEPQRVVITTLEDRRTRITAPAFSLVVGDGWQISQGASESTLFHATKEATGGGFRAIGAASGPMKYVLGTKSGCEKKGREVGPAFKADTMNAKVAKTALGATCVITMTTEAGMTTMWFFAGTAGNLVGFTCAGQVADTGGHEECKSILATWKNE